MTIPRTPFVAAAAFAAGVLVAAAPHAFGPAATVPPELAESMRAIWLENVDTAELEHEARMLASFHRDSPIREQAAALLAEVGAEFDYETTVRSFRPFAVDGDFAFARSAVRTEGRGSVEPGRAFVDNDLDSIVIFRLEDGRPKVWMTVPVEVRPVDRASGATAPNSTVTAPAASPAAAGK
jgi:hypothetical protein